MDIIDSRSLKCFDTDSGVSEATNLPKDGEVDKNNHCHRDSGYPKQTCAVATQCNIPYEGASIKYDMATQYDNFCTISRSVQCDIKCEDSVKKLSVDVFKEFQGTSIHQLSDVLPDACETRVSCSQLQSDLDATDVCACCHQVFKCTNLTYLKRNKPEANTSDNSERKTKRKEVNTSGKRSLKGTICQSLVVSSSQEPSSGKILLETVAEPNLSCEVSNSFQDSSENVITEAGTFTSLEGRYPENIQSSEKCYIPTKNGESKKMQTKHSSIKRKIILPATESIDRTQYCRSWLKNISHEGESSLCKKLSDVQSEVSGFSVTSSMDTVFIKESKKANSPSKTHEGMNDKSSKAEFGKLNKNRNLHHDLQSASVSKERKNSHMQNTSGLCASESYGISECESSGSEKQGQSKKRKTFKLYTRDEQIEILKFIIKNNYFHRVTTKSLWEELAMSGVLKGRSWESIRNHFRKTIGPNIRRYNLGKDVEKKFPPCKKYY